MSSEQGAMSGPGSVPTVLQFNECNRVAGKFFETLHPEGGGSVGVDQFGRGATFKIDERLKVMGAHTEVDGGTVIGLSIEDYIGGIAISTSSEPFEGDRAEQLMDEVSIIADLVRARAGSYFAGRAGEVAVKTFENFVNSGDLRELEDGHVTQTGEFWTSKEGILVTGSARERVIRDTISGMHRERALNKHKMYTEKYGNERDDDSSQFKQAYHRVEGLLNTGEPFAGAVRDYLRENGGQVFVTFHKNRIHIENVPTVAVGGGTQESLEDFLGGIAFYAQDGSDPTVVQEQVQGAYYNLVLDVVKLWHPRFTPVMQGGVLADHHIRRSQEIQTDSDSDGGSI